MAILKYANQSGTVYVYDVVSEWDPVKKQSRSKRKCIGKVDPKTGETVPTSGRRGRPKKSGAGTQPSVIPENSGGSGTGHLEADYLRLKTDYENLYKKNSELAEENRKMKAMIRRFCKEAAGITEKDNR